MMDILPKLWRALSKIGGFYMTDKEIAKKLIELVGGRDNIKSVENCMTRCRLEIRDMSKVDIDKIEKLEGTLGVVQAEGQLQVIYGPGKVNKVTQEVKNLLGTKILLGDEARSGD